MALEQLSEKVMYSLQVSILPVISQNKDNTSSVSSKEL